MISRLPATVELQRSPYGYPQPTIVVGHHHDHRQVAASVYQYASYAELESRGDWAVVANQHGTVALEMVRVDDKTVAAGMRALEAAVLATQALANIERDTRDAILARLRTMPTCGRPTGWPAPGMCSECHDHVCQLREQSAREESDDDV